MSTSFGRGAAGPRVFFRWAPALLVFLALLAAAGAQPGTVTTSVYDMRGDQGVLEAFGPRGVAWTPDGHLFVVDRRYNAFHIFDDQGRRFRFLDYPVSTTGICHYNGLARLNDKGVMYAIGSHYHVKNDARFLSARSVLNKIQLAGENLSEDSCKENLDPDSAFRATGYYGESAEVHLEVSGIAMDPRHNRVFVGCDLLLNKDGTVVVYTGPLDKLLAGDKSFRFELVKTGLKPETDPATGAKYFLSDLDYVDDKGLVLLLTAFSGEDYSDQMRFGANQIWFMPGAFGPAKPVLKLIAPGNRATGITLKHSERWSYTAALVCDNDMEDTRIPSRLVILKGLQLPLK